jgi:hypothetical protein
MIAATAKQINYIHSLCQDNFLSEADILAKVLGKPMLRENLNIEQASKVIEYILKLVMHL